MHAYTLCSGSNLIWQEDLNQCYGMIQKVVHVALPMEHPRLNLRSTVISSNGSKLTRLCQWWNEKCEDNVLCIYAYAKSLDSLKFILETLSKRMIKYCKETGLVLNSKKKQLLCSTKRNFEINIDSCVIKWKPEITHLGFDYDTYFTKNP